MHENGIFTWYTFAKEIFAEFELDNSEYENYDKQFKLIKNSFKKSIKKTVKEQYDKLLTDKLSSIDDSSKLFLYSKLKKEIELEEYLK